MSLGNVEMIVVGECVERAVQQTLGNMIGDSNLQAKAFIADIVLRWMPAMIVTDFGCGKITEKIFAIETNRSLVLNLNFAFWSFWSPTPAQVSGLIDTLAESLGLSEFTDARLIPEEVSQRLPVVSDIKSILRANNWLVVILLLRLFIVVDPKELGNA